MNKRKEYYAGRTVGSMIAFFFFAACFSAAAQISAQVDQGKKNAILGANDEKVLIAEMTSPDDTEAGLYYKSIAAKRLAQIGTAAAVPSLEPLLDREPTAHYARIALESIPAPEADAALLRAASKLEGDRLADVILSLGARRTDGSVPVILDALRRSDSAAVCRAAWRTLGLFADETALDTLQTGKIDGENPRVETPETNFARGIGLLAAAEKLRVSGEEKKSLDLYATILNGSFAPAVQRAARRETLLLENQEGKAAAILALLGSENPDEIEPALRVLRELPAEQAPTAVSVVQSAKNLPEERRFQTIQAVAERPDSQSAEAVLPILLNEAANGPTEERRILGLTGLKTAGRIAPEKSFDAAFCAVKTVKEFSENEPILKTAIAAISALPTNERLDAKILSSIETGAGPELWFAGTVAENRNLTAAAPKLLDRVAAMPENVPLRDRTITAAAYLVSDSEFERFVETVETLGDEGKTTRLLQRASTHLARESCGQRIAAMIDRRTKPDEKARLFGVLATLGGKNALAALEKAGLDPATADTATETLGRWNDPETIADSAETALKIARSNLPEKFRERALRAYLRAARQFNLPANQKIEMARLFFDSTAKPEDKLLVFGVFERLIDPASAEAAVSYAKEDFCREAACRAAVHVAKEFKEKTPRLVPVLKTVVETTREPALKIEAEKLLEKHEK